MQEVNWNNFKAKFNGKEQKSFEELCYHLFCSEFDQNKGIFGYKNQTGIETDPIEKDGEMIGWQAKFFETRISTKKEKLKHSIEAAKRKNPNVNKILFYINQKFPESRKKNKKDPDYKIEIENYGKSKGVKIEWRVPTHFEFQLALDKNKNIAQHFFGHGKSIIDFITELNQHSESILMPIHSKIVFNGNEIKIDRSITLKNLKTALEKSSLVILSGEGGTGKTAVIKDFYDQIKEIIPFFIFKASEFNISNINDLFKNYGGFTLSDFIIEQQGTDKKYIVIDSAEKLSDIENREVFQEFLSSLLKNNWRIIFTTRHSYLDGLKWQFVEIYNLSFQVINIENIAKKELYLISSKRNFNLPQNERLLELLLNPFYLNEYLQNYRNLKETETYSDFKNLLWNKKILNLSYRKNNIHLEREKCFLEIAKTRANSGCFYVTVDNCDNEALINLESDEIIKHDSDNDGYFITHDIYEEWALDKIIERNFNKTEDYKCFFNSLGSSLFIRRAFRNWLSEQLLINQDEVKSLIEESIINDEIEDFWKDEILVSVLLSDYSGVFFQTFQTKLLEENQKLLMRVVFLLRIACKEIDESFLHLLGLQKVDGIALKTVFTIPKGKGWHFAIDFIHKHKEKFGLRNINIILPLLDDWNNKNKEGETTQKASQIGLYYYEEIFTNGGFGYSSRDERKGQLIRVILQGSHEIKNELTCIFNEVISEKKTSHGDKYCEIVQTILTSITDSFEVVKSLPEYVIKLADLFWFQIPEKDNGYSRMDVEDYFCMADNYRFEYFPASAFQTPVFQLLRFSSKATIDFILSFTNKTVECYVKSELKNEAEEVEVFINETETIKQYISNRLWNTYRGTQYSTHLLESIHMALEKWLLEYAKTASQTELENLCIYLVKNSKSASITAVVASVVIAQPPKLFNIAKILFRTKEFFLYDTSRMIFDQTAKSLYSVGYGLNYKNKIYQDERIKTCDDEHRKISLEQIALNYQFVKSKDNDDFEKQRETLWGIWDEYYKKLPIETKQSEKDITWRLFLARMDIRKMTPKAELENDGDKIIITLNPEIDPKLKKYSKDSLQKSSDAMKYTSLKLWSDYRFKRDEDKYKQYQKYENNPQLVISKTQEIIDDLKKGVRDDFSLFNRSIPAYTCAVIIKDFFDKLSEKEKEFCKEVIIEFAAIPLRIGKYSYQIHDGTEPAIISLPQLIKYFPKNRDDIKLLLFLLLLNPQREISTFAIRGVLHDLWEINFEDAQSIFLGYLLLEPKYDDLINEILKENYKNIYEISEEVLKTFIKQYEEELNKIVSGKITYKDVGKLEQLSLEVLTIAFELLPLKTNNEDHKTFIKNISPIFSKKILIDDDRVDYALKQRFLEKFAYFVLTSAREEIETYLKPFVDNFSNSRDMADFFQEFISAEDRLNQYEEFWVVWDVFYKQVVEICKKGSSYYYAKEIVHNYLLAWPYWKENAKGWHSLKEREKIFFNKVAQDVGHHPSVLYSLSKILNDIGSNFLEDGVFWISGILQRNENLFSEELEINTIFYMENIVRRYILTNRQKIKTNKKIKSEVVVILNFLIERGSITGYLLREDIL
jgi:hypothetical protein